MNHKKSMMSAAKAKKMLKEGSAHGRKLTKKQKKLFGMIAGHKRPTRMSK